MIEQNKKNNNWKSKVALFYAKTTGWIIGPILLALAINRIFHFNSSFIFPVIIGIGFAVTCYGIYKEIKNYQKEL